MIEFSKNLGFPVSLNENGEYLAKVEYNRVQGEVWHLVDGRQIEKSVREKLKSAKC